VNFHECEFSQCEFSNVNIQHVSFLHVSFLGPNKGNWCFANSTLQALCSIDRLMRLFDSFDFALYVNE